MPIQKHYPLIVIGGGHAGIEAILPNTKNHIKTLLITLNKASIGKMPCNPSIGGSGKGNLVRELDALGGEMGRAADKNAMLFSMLNTSKGEAVHSPRALVDKHLYHKHMLNVLENQEYLDIFEGELANIFFKNNKITSIQTLCGITFTMNALILATGTFLKSIMHIGNIKIQGGQNNEKSSEYLSKVLENDLNLKLGRLKTGTCPRVEKESLDFNQFKLQETQGSPTSIKFSSQEENYLKKNLVNSYSIHTNEKTYDIIKNNIHKSAIYSGNIKATGVRYCLAIEDKIYKFPEKVRQQIFVETVSLSSNEIYLNGLATSLPQDIQNEFIRSIPGFEKVKILNWGYAVEYDFIYPYQIFPTMKAKSIENLFLAGQINGTSGYEEAAVQGFIAGINAYLYLKDKDPFILDRSEAYIGVLTDNLTTKNISEPYRIFSSQCEYRLSLRYDNIDERLMKYGYQFNFIKEETYHKNLAINSKIQKAQSFIENYTLKNLDLNKNSLYQIKGAGYSLLKLIKQNIKDIKSIAKDFEELKDLSEEMLYNLSIKIKYEGYIKKQEKSILKFKKNENLKIPIDFDYHNVEGLLKEAKEKLIKFKPSSLGQASRIEGVDPTAIELLFIYIKRKSH